MRTNPSGRARARRRSRNVVAVKMRKKRALYGGFGWFRLAGGGTLQAVVKVTPSQTRGPLQGGTSRSRGAPLVNLLVGHKTPMTTDVHSCHHVTEFAW